MKNSGCVRRCASKSRMARRQAPRAHGAPKPPAGAPCLLVCAHTPDVQVARAAAHREAARRGRARHVQDAKQGDAAGDVGREAHGDLHLLACGRADKWAQASVRGRQIKVRARVVGKSKRALPHSASCSLRQQVNTSALPAPPIF